MADVTRADIGFQGGQVLSLRLKPGELDRLSEALRDAGSERWHELAAQDSQVFVDLSQVVYVRVDAEAQRVGF